MLQNLKCFVFKSLFGKAASWLLFVTSTEVNLFFLPQNIPRVASLGVECVSSFALDYWLQTHLFQAGVLWYLLGYLFNYDYTLEESGIQKSEDSNHQVMLTRCRLSDTACCLPSLTNKNQAYSDTS